MARTEASRPVAQLLDLILVLFAALAVALRPLLHAHTGESNLWVEMCVVLAAMAWVVRMALGRRVRLVRTGLGIPVLVLLAVAALSTLASPHKAASVAKLLEWVSAAALFTVLANAAAEWVDRRFFLRVLWASAFVVILYGLLQQFVNLPLLLEQIESDPERVAAELRLDPELLDDLKVRARGRIFSTFLLANCFAGFLALVIPGFVGHVLDRLRAGHRGKLFLGAAAAWLVGALACLLLTYSKGGWLAFAFGSLLFVAMLGKGLLRRHARLVGTLGLAAVLGAGALFATRIVPVKIFRDAAGSFDVRAGYWRGALAMARDKPLTGVGLGTFASNYPRYRWAKARMAKEAHNDYLQVLAELGIFGLAAFLAVWGVCLWRGFARSGGAPPPGQAKARFFRPWVGYAAGVVAFVLSRVVVATSFTFSGWGDEPWWPLPKLWCDHLLVLALLAAWVLFYAALGGIEKAGHGELCRKGLLCGLVAFLLHCAVDFDYNEPGVMLTAWVVAALCVVPRGQAFERRLSPGLAACLAGLAFVAVVGFEYLLVQAYSAESDRAAARSLFAEASREKDPRHQDKLFRDACRRYDKALRQSRLDDSLRIEYADALHGRLHAEGYADPQLFARAEALYLAAAALNRASPSPYVRLARLYEQTVRAGKRPPRLAALLRRLTVEQPPPPGSNPAHLPAVVAYRAAIERAPNEASLRLRFAEALADYGDLDAARRELALAIELHETVLTKHPEHVMRLKEDELATARKLQDRLARKRAAP